MKKERELRMYFFVMCNIGTIDKGIQSGHCAQEYSNQFGKTKLYKDWFKNHKTFILLNGGTSNNGMIFYNNSRQNGEWSIDSTKYGTMELYEHFLIDNNIPYASFHEPDLNNALSALCFICDEKIFDWETYPPFLKWVSDRYKLSDEEKEMKTPYNESDYLKLEYQMWINFVGGKQNSNLKELIYGKKLA
jgi:hypothetical protein